ncbi:hypothetical protein TPY_1566 [Sulfobacillus acidophilus TPY]|uniref:Rhodanese-like protein n=1 Tax=Sulfobacillus acidophilus (strain ATCC 700253 / DSM 10332 / NAL) TaxID=679936 RepID=G8TZM2_SULAD|nr:hypothetical protein TPY_1566 [Sulfobacillus acidophilus TPY]AEW05262.1 Rhodanese-like protein [Sulfobacillus acidophilus DSM 10332]
MLATNLILGLFALYGVWHGISRRWGVRTIAPTEWALINHRNYTVIDLRSTEAFETAHLDTAINVPEPTLFERLADIPRDRPILLVDYAGRQSRRVFHQLGRNGFDNHRVLTGGLLKWYRFRRLESRRSYRR